MIGAAFHEILYRPLFNALIALYEYAAFSDLGIAIVLLTILIRILLYPLFSKSARSQAVMQKIQPQIKKIQEDHKSDREKQSRALLDLYKTNNVNPFSGIFLLLVQLPILIALYRVFLSELTPAAFAALYAFIPAPEAINFSFLGLINLHERSTMVAIAAAGAQYIHGKCALPKQSTGNAGADMIGRQMIVLAPVITLFVLWGLPSAIGIYWLTSSFVSVIQQVRLNRIMALAHGGDEHNRSRPQSPSDAGGH
ncbi:MAG: YidC/Oxa1 family membrane protein insertase [Candidatus Liptonbacteria bacterium]|nr:YidC/Oxa1 family membrane protein insertase [Candidatus Liptonbacteria bacterium]